MAPHWRPAAQQGAGGGLPRSTASTRSTTPGSPSPSIAAACAAGCRLPVLVQVNVARDDGKRGVDADGARELCAAVCCGCPGSRSTAS
jgi:hypothetical protein